jgi:hypothetical protein
MANLLIFRHLQPINLTGDVNMECRVGGANIYTRINSIAPIKTRTKFVF